MKNPLLYQRTEYDCGPTSILNAISYLFERDDIPPDVIKTITLYCMDSYDNKGNVGKNGTSQMAMMFISGWLNHFAGVKQFSVQTEYLAKNDVVLAPGSKIDSAIKQGGAVVARVMYGCWHYVLITGARDGKAYLFDPYYRKRPFTFEGLEIIDGQPTKANRAVPFTQMNREDKSPYAFGKSDLREAVIFYNTKTKKRYEPIIEYFI